MIERRESPRRNTCFFRAFVYFENSTTAVDCVVRDISDTGARLQFPKVQNFTELLDLHIPIKGANCYLIKPVQLDEFENLVKSISDFWLTKVKLTQQPHGR
jgi:hypothetical protein